MEVYESSEKIEAWIKKRGLRCSPYRRFFSIRSIRTGDSWHGLYTYNQAVEVANQIAEYELSMAYV